MVDSPPGITRASTASSSRSLRTVDASAPASRSAAIAHFEELALNDFVIDPGRYLSLPQAELDIDETIEQRSALLAQLERLTRESREADSELAAILGEGSS